jgi:hypothetical protein
MQTLVCNKLHGTQSFLLENLILKKFYVFYEKRRQIIVLTKAGHWPLPSALVLLLCFVVVGWDWVHLVRRPLFGLLYQPRMIDDVECGAVGVMRIGRVNRSTRRKPAPVPLCPPQIPHDLNWARTGVATVGSQRLTAWAMAQPCPQQ